MSNKTTLNYEETIAKFLDINVDDLQLENYDHYGLEIYNGYAVGTEEEADKAVEEHIKDSAWAFNPEFLQEMTDIPQAAFAAMQDKCEDSNDPILQIIEQSCGLEDFVEAAVGADGRGHFLSSYDGNEHEEYFKSELDGKIYPIYFYKQ